MKDTQKNHHLQDVHYVEKDSYCLNDDSTSEDNTAEEFPVGTFHSVDELKRKKQKTHKNQINKTLSQCKRTVTSQINCEILNMSILRTGGCRNQGPQ